MLRLPARINLGPYTLHLDILGARLQRRRRRVQQLAEGVLVLLVLVIGAIIGFPVLRGTGVIAVPNHDSSLTFTLDGRVLTGNSVRVFPGRHVLHIEQVGAFPVEQIVEVTKEQTTTLTLPLLRSIPRVQQLPLPYSQSVWTQVDPDVSGGWRIAATQPVSEDGANLRPGWGATTAERPPRALLHLDAEGLTPLPVLETYAAADEIVTAQGERFWAAWEANKTASQPGVVGTLSLTTPWGTQALSTTVTLEGLWWSPGGRMLLVAVIRNQLVDLALLDPEHPQTAPIEPIITVAGVIQSVNWQPDGRAVVVTSVVKNATEQSKSPSHSIPTPQNSVAPELVRVPRSAVLLRIPSDTKPQAVRLHSPPAHPAGIVSLDWSADDLWWIADTGLGLALEQVSLSDDTVRRVSDMPQDVVAFTVLSDTTIRIIRRTENRQLVVERWPEAIPLFTLPGITAHNFVGGIWRDTNLVLAISETELWYVHIQPEALQ